jgi:cobaltochelatase CobN
MLDIKDTAWIIGHYFRHEGRNLIHALISPMMFSLSLTRPGEEKLLADLGVPVIQAINVLASRQQWWETVQGITPMDVCISVAQPEFDGNLIAVPLATRETRGRDPLTGAVLTRMKPVTERINKLVRLGLNWAGLSRKSNAEKRVAIIFHNYPPRNDKIGCAYGLDSFASVAELVRNMKDQGYQVERTYDDPQELADLMVGGLSNDQRCFCPSKWPKKPAPGQAGSACRPGMRSCPKKTGGHMCKDWGGNPGELFVHEAGF